MKTLTFSLERCLLTRNAVNWEGIGRLNWAVLRALHLQ